MGPYQHGREALVTQRVLRGAGRLGQAFYRSSSKLSYIQIVCPKPLDAFHLHQACSMLGNATALQSRMENTGFKYCQAELSVGTASLMEIVNLGGAGGLPNSQW